MNFDIRGAIAQYEGLEVRADSVHVGDLAWLPTNAFEHDWVLVTKIELEGNEDVVFNGGTTTSMGNPVDVIRRKP